MKYLKNIINIKDNETRGIENEFRYWFYHSRKEVTPGDEITNINLFNSIESALDFLKYDEKKLNIFLKSESFKYQVSRVELILKEKETDTLGISIDKLSLQEIRTLELESNYYNRNELVEFLNEGLELNQIPIKCFINSDDNFVFESNENKKFIMKWDENSILPYLGFTKSTYLNKTKYESEKTIDIGDNIFYLVIENISEEPIFMIDQDSNSVEKLIELDSNLEVEVDHLIIKFYKTKKYLIKNNNEYSFFFEHEHTIDFEII